MKKDGKSIKLTISFFTSGLPNQLEETKLTPCWLKGHIYLNANKTKSIKPQQEIFNSLEEIPIALKKVFRKGKLIGITNLN
jgi:hypothetical protein